MLQLSPFCGCQSVLLWGQEQCIAMCDGCVYTCKLYSVRNVPSSLNLVLYTLKLLKHVEFQPLPDRTLLQNSLEITYLNFSVSLDCELT